MNNDYTKTDTSVLIDGIAVIDRNPTVDDVRGCVTDESGFLSWTNLVDRNKILAVNPTPCGVYDGDDDRWEVSEVIVNDHCSQCPVQVGDFLGLYKTLDDAIRDALGLVNPSVCGYKAERVYIMRDAV